MAHSALLQLGASSSACQFGLQSSERARATTPCVCSHDQLTKMRVCVCVCVCVCHGCVMFSRNNEKTLHDRQSAQHLPQLLAADLVLLLTLELRRLRAERAGLPRSGDVSPCVVFRVGDASVNSCHSAHQTQSPRRDDSSPRGSQRKTRAQEVVIKLIIKGSVFV